MIPFLTLALATTPHGPHLDDATVQVATTTAPTSALLVPRDDWDRDYAVARRDGTYLQIGFGLLTTTNSAGPGEEIDFDEGYAVPFAIGQRMYADDGNAFALDVELEAYWSDQDTDDPSGPINALTDVTVLGGFVNGIGDLALSDSFSLYAGGGLGLAFLDVGTQSDALNDFDDEDGPFLAWQLKAGLRWYTGAASSWSLGYRFVNVDDAEIDDDLGAADFDLETEQHVIALGWRFGV